MNKKYFSHAFTAFSGGASFFAFYQSLGKEIVTAKLENQMTINATLTKNINESLEKNISDTLFNGKILSKTDELKTIRHHNQESFNRMLDKFNSLKKDTSVNNDSIISQIQSDINTVTNEVIKENLKMEELNQMVINRISGNDNSPMPDNILESGPGREIFDNISNLFNSYTEYLGTLNTIELGALTNLIFTFLIFSSLISLIVIFFSDYIIKRLNFTNYPRIKKFLDLRRKFQVYYFIFNALMIFVGVLALLFVNVSLFLNY